MATEPGIPDVLEMEPNPATVAGPFRPDLFVTDAWERHSLELYTFLRRATRDEAVAEDLLQETFVRLTTEVGAGRAPERLRPWLYRVASNLATSRGRRLTTVRRFLQVHGVREAQPGVEESLEVGYERRERRSELEAVLAGLSPDARTALLLARDGFSGEEIAATIGRSHAATRTLLCRARVQVRLELERRRGDL